jgi:esterase/lipase superfamily enzyme
MADFGPYRELAGLNFGKSRTTTPYPDGLSPTLLVDQSAWERDLTNRVNEQGPPVIYIHGFNNSEDVAVRRARAIGSLLKNPRPVIAMTWPSYANPTAIGWDEANNEWAREALEGELARIVGQYKGTILIAHSMGNRILLDFLVTHSALIGNVGQIIAAAPDVDEDQFMRHMEQGVAFGPRITIYVSTKDQALAGSWRWHGMRRAGDLSASAGNEKVSLRYRQLDPSVAIVDLTHTKSDWWEHSNFIATVPGAADLCRVLNEVSSTELQQHRTILIQKPYYQIPYKDPQPDDCTTRAKLATEIDAGLK